MPDQGTNVFVSYSHADASLVAPVVKLLRVNKSLVFQDIDDIQPGKKWRDEIARGLAESNLVVVFWCDHANHSDEVRKEWKAAVEQDKDLLPVLLDATPLPPELGEFQWIDFRAAVGTNHTSIAPPPNDAATGRPQAPAPAPPPRSGRRLWLGGLATLVVAAVVVGSLLTTTVPVEMVATAPPGPADPTPAPVQPLPTPPLSAASDTLLSDGVGIWLALLLAVAGGFFWLMRWRSKRRKTLESTKEAPCQEMERQIARELEAEIVRRTGLKQDAGT